MDEPVDEPDALGSRLDHPQPPADRADGAVDGSAHAALPSLAKRRALLAGATTLAGIVLFFCYLQLSRTYLLDSDGASNALQAWAMLHGNPLLRGWTLSDVSFYTTELPEYMLVELVHGLNGEVVHIAAGLTYTLLVVLVALVAKGQATGRRAGLRMLLAVGIMISPQLGFGVHVLLMQPDHTGTSVIGLHKKDVDSESELRRDHDAGGDQDPHGSSPAGGLTLRHQRDQHDQQGVSQPGRDVDHFAV